ncbi:MAG: riboflavin synthase [Patescibacteria group bacterium]|nr:riboflavin synthase [Patescibacteria group bacterium]
MYTAYMFTGIITKKGKVISSTKKNNSCFLTIEKPKGWKIKEGESIVTDGVCLTVKKINNKNYISELMEETLKKTTFGKIVPQYVNLEQSLRLTDRLSGHFVTGHIDTVGVIKKISRSGTSSLYTISFPKSFQKLIVKKGSIAIDGVSLTVVDTHPGIFSVAILPYTLEKTTLGDKKVGMSVNLEFDILAKYIQNNK